MAFLWKSTKKSPKELVAQSSTAINLLIVANPPTKQEQKTIEELPKYVNMMKLALAGSWLEEAQREFVRQLASEINSASFLHLAAANLALLDFEVRKDIASIFSNILKWQEGAVFPTVVHIVENPSILTDLVDGYDEPATALNCGAMLRCCIQHKDLAALILNSDNFYKFFTFVEAVMFHVATDAFYTLRHLLTYHASLCSRFLEENYEKVFEHYGRLLHSSNYVTRRQSLKLLGELLLDHSNTAVMRRYIEDPDNLKATMVLLRDKSRNIQFESFHVFKIFVANPNKPEAIMRILLRNREKLILFLSDFHTDRKDDEQFTEEKAYLLAQIEALDPNTAPRPPSRPRSRASSSAG